MATLVEMTQIFCGKFQKSCKKLIIKFFIPLGISRSIIRIIIKFILFCYTRNSTDTFLFQSAGLEIL